MNSKAIVTLADSNYFELLNELIDSINKHDDSKSISICVLDAGLTDQQRKDLKKKVYAIKKAEWDIKVPGYKVLKEWLKAKSLELFFKNIFQNLKNIFG